MFLLEKKTESGDRVTLVRGFCMKPPGLGLSLEDRLSHPQPAPRAPASRPLSGSTSWPRSCTGGCCSSGAPPCCPCAWATSSTSWGEWGARPRGGRGPAVSRAPRPARMPSPQARCRHGPLAARPVGEGAGPAPHARRPQRDPPRCPVSERLGPASGAGGVAPRPTARGRPDGSALSAVCLPSSPCSSSRWPPRRAPRRSVGSGRSLRAPRQSGGPSRHAWSPTGGSPGPHTSRTSV